MDKKNNSAPPEGLDDFLADMDPQSAVASGALSNALGQIGELPGVKKALDFEGNLKSYEALVAAAQAGDPAARQQLAEHSAGMAMGTIKGVPEAGFGKVTADIRDAGKTAFGKVTSSIKDAGKPNYGKVTVIEVPEAPIGKVTNDISQAGPQTFGKVVQPDVAPTPKTVPLSTLPGFADGGEIPAGLDAFLADEAPVPGVPPMGDMPEGLDEFIAPEMRAEKYGSMGQMAKAGLEGAAQGLVGPLAPMAERALGVDPEDIRGRSETNPLTHYAGEITGLVAPALATSGASLASRAGLSGVAEAIPTLSKFTQVGALEHVAKLLPVAGETLASKVGTGAAKAAIDNMLIAGSDEVSKMIIKDPAQSAETALTSIGLAGVLGAGLGGATEAVLPLWKATVGSKASKLVADFKGRINEHLTNPEPVSSMGDELGGYYKSMKDLAPKAAVAEEEAAAPMAMASGEKPRIDPFKIRSRDKPEGLAPSESRIGSLSGASKLETKFTESLAKAHEEFKPALKDFEKKFTTELNGERSIDPGKISTYLNQLGRPNAEIKQQVLSNFLEASEKYKKTVEKLHGDMGAKSPVSDSPMNVTMATLNKKTLGSKIADAFIEKGLTDAGGKAAGAAIGGMLGHMAGSSALGAIVGGHALGPFFSSILPSIAKALVDHPGADGTALKTALDYTASVVKGEALLSKASKGIFKATQEALPAHAMPTDKDVIKLNRTLRLVQNNPDLMFKAKSDNTYLPEHGMAVDQTKANAITYLNSLRTDLDKKAPLDSAPVASSTQNAKFINALRIAQQPLIVLDKVKKGTLTSNDIEVIGATYPSLYNRMKEKINTDMIDTISKGHSIPYRTRIGISMFLAQPLDSTMSPASIQATQPQGAAPRAAQAPDSKGTKSSPALQKLPNMYQTPTQARVQSKNKD